jgi:hypothetical protein
MTEVTLLKQQSQSGASWHGWSVLTPDLLEKARGRVRFIGWLMLVFMGLGAAFDLVFSKITTGELNDVWVGVAVIAIGN